MMAKSTIIRDLIVKLHQRGISFSEISRQIGVDRSVVSRTIKRWKEFSTLQDRPRKGRPRCLTKKIERLFLRTSRTFPFMTNKEIWNRVKPVDLDLQLHKRTIARVLSRNHIGTYRPLQKPLLTRDHEIRRLTFANDHEFIDWNAVIFSDEKRFRFEHEGHRYVKRERGHREDSKYTIGTKKYGGGSVMIWAAIRSDGKLWIQRCHDHLTGMDYQWIIENTIEERNIFDPNISKQWYFQQDGAPPHSTKATKLYFEQMGVHLLDWPAQSPDLNIIENLWPLISRALPKATFRNQDDAWGIIKGVCEENRFQEAIKRLYDSIPRRLQECQQRRGKAILY